MRGTPSFIKSPALCRGLDCVPSQHGWAGGRKGQWKCQGRCPCPSHSPARGSAVKAEWAAHSVSDSVPRAGHTAAAWHCSTGMALSPHQPRPRVPAGLGASCAPREVGGSSPGLQNLSRSGKSRSGLIMNMGEMRQGRESRERGHSVGTDAQHTGMLLEPVLSMSQLGRRAEHFIFHLNQPGLFSEL